MYDFADSVTPSVEAIAMIVAIAAIAAVVAAEDTVLRCSRFL